MDNQNHHQRHMDNYAHHRQRYTAALNHLTQPQQVTNIQGMTHPMDPIITQMLQAAHGMSGAGAGAPGGGYGSKTPIWTAAYDWCADVNKTITKLAKHTNTHIPKGDTLHALDRAYSLPFNPTNAAHLDRAATQLEHHHRMALKLLFPPMFEIDAPCPQCHHTHTHHHGAEGETRMAALTVHDMWAECGACGKIWEGIEVIALARAVATEQIPTV